MLQLKLFTSHDLAPFFGKVILVTSSPKPPELVLIMWTTKTRQHRQPTNNGLNPTISASTITKGKLKILRWHYMFGRNTIASHQ